MRNSRRRTPRTGVQTLRIGCTGGGCHDWISLGTAERCGKDGRIWITSRTANEHRTRDWYPTADRRTETGLMRETVTFRCRNTDCDCTVPMVTENWQEPLRKLMGMGQVRLDISELRGYAPGQ